MSRHDIIICGGGLAGTCAAFVLSATERVLLLEAEHPGAGATGAAAGLVNPFMAHRARPAWRLNDALAALHTLLEEAGARALFRGGGVLRPARSAKQVRFFEEAAQDHPAHTAWLPPAAATARFPAVTAPHGALLVTSGGTVDAATFVEALLRAAERRGAVVQTGVRVTGWGESRDVSWVAAEQNDTTIRVEARHVLLALGQGYPAFPELARSLDLHGIKGQTVRVRRPFNLPTELPALSGFGYVAPAGETLVVGSSYEHDFETLAPSPAATQRILRKAARMLPGLEEASVCDVRTGVRVKRRDAHLPLVGPLPGRRRLWTFTGLGSKGLLTAPLLARALPDFLAKPETIPSVLRPPAALPS